MVFCVFYFFILFLQTNNKVIVTFTATETKQMIKNDITLQPVNITFAIAITLVVVEKALRA